MFKGSLLCIPPLSEPCSGCSIRGVSPLPLSNAGVWLTTASRPSGMDSSWLEPLSSCRAKRGWRRNDGGGLGLVNTGGGRRLRLGGGGGSSGAGVEGVLTGTTTRGTPEGDKIGGGMLAKAVRGARGWCWCWGAGCRFLVVVAWVWG